MHMKITSITVDKPPKHCKDCVFYDFYLSDPEERLMGLKECKLKVWMGNPVSGITLLPCPLDRIRKEA